MNRKNVILLLLLAVATACGDRGKIPKAEGKADTASNPQSEIYAAKAAGSSGRVLIASDIVTDVIIRPDPEGDPWEIEKVAGFNGNLLINTIFDRIYAGTLKAYEYHTGEPMTAREVKEIESEFSNDRSRIGKLSFTEDWYYDPAANKIEKVTKSIVFGFELYNEERKVYAYRAAFRTDLASPDSARPHNNP